jgi:hypothetical protein
MPINIGSTAERLAAAIASGIMTYPACEEPIDATPAVIRKIRNGSSARRSPAPAISFLNNAVDGSVNLGDAEEVGDAPDKDQDVNGKSGQDVPNRHARQPNADDDGGGKHQDAEMNAAERRDREHGDEDSDRKRGHWTPRSYAECAKTENGRPQLNVLGLESLLS